MKKHTFHIPVMGTGFTIDTPLKTAHFGIDSVVSLVDDKLMERLRKMYCEKFNLPFAEISEKIEDFRAKRIASYLNLLNELVNKKIEALKHAVAEKEAELKSYFCMLPDAAAIKEEFKKLMAKKAAFSDFVQLFKNSFSAGAIDVNIMTKLDRENYVNNQKMPSEYNDAHAALRGFAMSELHSSVIFSAGMNPRLYSYIESFESFYPDKEGVFQKKITLKVSDYRSALIQGKFLAKKGLWVSEFRVESGLNCGGHAFATDGYLLGPILAEFRDHREELRQTLFAIYSKALEEKKKTIPPALPIKLTVQGGVGTAEEHQFLLDHYKVDSVGWGTPFLLVPEVTNVDEETLQKLSAAKEDDLYLSNISPLGVPFNSLRGNSRDLDKEERIKKGIPGSPCPKKYLAFNKEYNEAGICVASRKYQALKLAELERAGLPEKEHQRKFERITDKSCICSGLGTVALMVNDMDTIKEGFGVSICPGPNLAYFSKICTLAEMTDHIYGRANVISRTDRPHMFIKELGMYVDYLKNKLAEMVDEEKTRKELSSFIENLNAGLDYYTSLFGELKGWFEHTKNSICEELENARRTVNSLLEMQPS